MSNNYVPNATDLLAGELARASDINLRYSYVVSGFDKLPTPLSSGQGFSAPVPVGAPTADAHAVTKLYTDTTVVANANAAALAHIQPSVTAAANSATAAATSENNADTSETNAGTSAAGALSSKNAAAASQTAAAGSATQAANIAAASSSSATNAASSATAAAGSATAAANSATSSGDDATLGEASRVAAVAAKTAAETAETNAETAETNAATSASAAATSATNANSSKVAAAQSATAANTSKVAAETAKTAAETAETNAETAETSAASSATNAANSATAGATSATNSANSATAAATSATASANSATAAASSASSASSSATSATTAANQASLVTTQINNFFDTYFVSSSEPSGSNLTVGDLWYDTTASILKLYTASGFINVNSSVNGTSERFEFVVGTAQSTSAGQYAGSTTVFPAIYDPGFLDVYKNGVRIPPAQFTATNGNAVTLASAASSGDTLSLIGYGNFQTANHYSKTQSDVIYGQKITDLEDEILLQLGV